MIKNILNYKINGWNHLPPDVRFHESYTADPNSGCWLWLGATNTKDQNLRYGSLSVNGKNVLAHRYSWVLHYGEIQEGMHICHKCDNKLCVNPKHFFLGTPKDNMHDMFTKRGGNPNPNFPYTYHGEDHLQAKLTADIVKDIFFSGEKTSVLTKKYGISRTRVQKIRNGRAWKHLNLRKQP
jgi:hypothetical protein